MGDSDSEDLDEDGADEEEEEKEKSVIIDNGSRSDSSKEVGGSSGSITGGKLDSGSVDQGSSGNGSEEEDTEESLKSVRNLDVCTVDGNIKSTDSPEENKD